MKNLIKLPLKRKPDKKSNKYCYSLQDFLIENTSILGQPCFFLKTIIEKCAQNSTHYRALSGNFLVSATGLSINSVKRYTDKLERGGFIHVTRKRLSNKRNMINVFSLKPLMDKFPELRRYPEFKKMFSIPKLGMNNSKELVENELFDPKIDALPTPSQGGSARPLKVPIPSPLSKKGGLGVDNLLPPRDELAFQRVTQDSYQEGAFGSASYIEEEGFKSAPPFWKGVALKSFSNEHIKREVLPYDFDKRLEELQIEFQDGSEPTNVQKRNWAKSFNIQTIQNAILYVNERVARGGEINDYAAYFYRCLTVRAKPSKRYKRFLDAQSKAR